MSLFKTQDWWFVPSDTNEEEVCHGGHLVIGNITNVKNPISNLIVGSFTGRLKIFSPQVGINEEDKEVYGYMPDHLVLEVVFDEPILQLAIGKYVSGNSNSHLCVLHPNHFVVYSVSLIEGKSGHGSQANLSKNYQHNFLRTAFNMITGNFGNVKGKDFIAVQSLDGVLSFYEQESPIFVCHLPQFLLPSLFVYVPSSDCLVTQNADWTLLSYKYQTLASLDQEDRKIDNNLNKPSKRVSSEWDAVLSEVILDMKILPEAGSQYSIVVLSSRSFSSYKDSGVLKFFKKLEYNPSCFTIFSNDNSSHICVASHTQTLLVYKETELIWAAQLPFVPVAIERADFKGITGSLVLLQGNGSISICYLGTNPSLFVAPPIEIRDLDYEAVDVEMARLNDIIRSSTKDTGSLVSLGGRSTKGIFISTSLGTELEKWLGPSNAYDPEGIPCVSLIVRLTTHSPVNNVRLDIDVEKPLMVTQECFVMNTICDNCHLLVKVYLSESYVPPSLKVTLVASFIAVDGTPLITKHETSLPLSLVAKAANPEKEAEHKVTVSTNKGAIALQQLFPDFSQDSSSLTALGFVYYGFGATVTLLSSRTTNRYRIQSDCLPAVWLVFDVLNQRLKKYAEVKPTEGDPGPLTVNVTSSVPLQELFSEIDAAFIRMKKRADLEDQLRQRSNQFVAIQRRLLTKCKDKTPTPLANLDTLLEATYKEIVHFSDAIISSKKGSEEGSCRLSCLLRLTAEMVCLQTGKDLEDIIRASFFPRIVDCDVQGWLESSEQMVSFTLRSVTGKTSRGGLVSNAPGGQGGAFDTSRFKKRISSLVEAVQKGIPDRNQASKEEPARSESASKSAKPLEGVAVPPGSKLGEGRARSARIRSARLIPTVPEEPEPEPTNSHDESENSDESGNVLPGNAHSQALPEPIYEVIYEQDHEGQISTEDQELNDQDTKDTEENEEIPETKSLLEDLKKSTALTETLLETPTDIFGDPVDEEGW